MKQVDETLMTARFKEQVQYTIEWFIDDIEMTPTVDQVLKHIKCFTTNDNDIQFVKNLIEELSQDVS